MISYKSSNQLTLSGFKSPFSQQLDPQNRWVVLAELIPWDDLACQYARHLHTDGGRNSIDIRCVIGAVIIKHKEKLSDRATVDHISENLYMQYFCGLAGFTTQSPFDASLFVSIRKRLGQDTFDKFHTSIIEHYDRIQGRKKVPKKAKENTNIEHPPKGEPSDEQLIANQSQVEVEESKAHKGKLKLDATVADQYIKYPTDLNLLNESRENLERMIDLLYKMLGWNKKPRTYRRKARKQYLNVSKKKNKSIKILRRSIKAQLQYVRRDIKIVHQMLDALGSSSWPLAKRDQRLFWVIQLVYDQQKYMHDNKVKSHLNRIVNIHQPYVRPIVRGKDKHKVEFGAKLSVSEHDGMARVDKIHWEASNESKDLQSQVEQYKAIHGYYPEVVIADQIYGSRQNRNWLKALGIRYSGKPLGRPPKVQKTAYQKRKEAQEQRSRNHIEGKFGQAKNGYRLNQIRAKRQDTSESWINSIFFVINLIKMYQWYTKKMKKTAQGFLLSIFQKLYTLNKIGISILNQQINCRSLRHG